MDQELDIKRRDRVTPPVRNATATWGGVGFIIALALRTFLDWEVDPDEAEAWWNTVQTIVIPAIPIVAGLIGAIRGSWAAREKVTPVSDPYLWDEVSGSWQPAQVMPRASNPGPQRNPRRDQRRPR